VIIVWTLTTIYRLIVTAVLPSSPTTSETLISHFILLHPLFDKIANENKLCIWSRFPETYF
jgi:hypothetical protein